IVVKKRLDIEKDIYLKDHAIENVPYMPAVMGIEAFAEASNLLYPDMQITSMKNIKFELPIKLLKDNPIDIFITVEKDRSSNGDLKLMAKIETEFHNKDGIKLGTNKLHFIAEIYPTKTDLNFSKPEGDGRDIDIIARFSEDSKLEISDIDIYKRFFHGPKFQVHGGVLDIDSDRIIGIMTVKDGDIFNFIDNPEFISNPMAIEAAFQNAGVLGMKRNNVMSLPDTIDELLYRNVPENIDKLYVRAKYAGAEDNKQIFDTEIIDRDGNIYSVMKGYKMITTGVLNDSEKF
ncbi:MAG: polyketide synthase dehydratase domain-containing protein, partial [Spirochaetota bacterium]|nr:polyketide synthase dehydratase domain-containing protein [Spirochaetota bacterium]